MRELERAKRFELSTLTLARLCSTPELRPLGVSRNVGLTFPLGFRSGTGGKFPSPLGEVGAGEAIRTPDPNLGKVMLYP